MLLIALKIFLLVLLSTSIQAFYLTSLTPNVFCKNQIEHSKCKTQVEVFVNSLDSVQSSLSYEYSHFDFCGVTDELSSVENLGQVLFGERIRPSPYKFSFLKDEECHLVCRKKYANDNAVSQKMLKRLMKGMVLNYQQHWIVDNIPVTLCYKTIENQEYCSQGFSIGCYVDETSQSKESCNIRDGKNDTFYVFNHLDFEITYQNTQDETWENEGRGEIIAVKVYVNSLNSDKCDRNAEPLMFQSTTKDVDIPFTYSIKFVKNIDIRWTNRWDYVIKQFWQIYTPWNLIFYSSITVLVLCGINARLLLHTLRKDIVRYNQMVDADTAEDESKHNLVENTVDHQPRYGMLLSVLVGNGVQMGLMTIITLIFLCFAFLLPGGHELLTICAVVCYILLGISAGYTSTRLYKMFGGEKWMINTLLTAFLCPGVIFGIFIVLKLVYWTNDFSVIIPLTKFLLSLALWFFALIPFVFSGTYIARKQPLLEIHHKINNIPFQIRESIIWTKTLPSSSMGLILPLTYVSITLYLVLKNVGTDHSYYKLSILLAAFIFLLTTCSEIAVLVCYRYLNTKNYHWWWRLFLTSGSTALHFFIFAVYYFFINSQITGEPTRFIYFGYTFILTFMLFTVTGTLGLLGCFWFTGTDYSSVKRDKMQKVAVTNV